MATGKFKAGSLLNPSEQAPPMHNVVDMFSLRQRSAGGLDFVQVPTVKLNRT